MKLISDYVEGGKIIPEVTEGSFFDDDTINPTETNDLQNGESLTI
jgi:hypothetical protein